VLECPGKIVACVCSTPIGGSFLNQEMKKSVIGGRNGSSQTCLSRILRLLVDEEKSLLSRFTCSWPSSVNDWTSKPASTRFYRF
jgi:hypothetical protein